MQREQHEHQADQQADHVEDAEFVRQLFRCSAADSWLCAQGRSSVFVFSVTHTDCYTSANCFNPSPRQVLTLSDCACVDKLDNLVTSSQLQELYLENLDLCDLATATLACFKQLQVRRAVKSEAERVESVLWTGFTTTSFLLVHRCST